MDSHHTTTNGHAAASSRDIEEWRSSIPKDVAPVAMSSSSNLATQPEESKGRRDPSSERREAERYSAKIHE